MKAKQLRDLLNHMIEDHGEEFPVVIQDSPRGSHPECCKHDLFFAVEEPREEQPGMELALRTWPY